MAKPKELYPVIVIIFRKERLVVKKDKKDVCLSVRCTKAEKDKIHRLAVKKGKSDTKYIIDCCMAAVERNKDKVQMSLIKIVELAECANQIEYVLDEYENQIPQHMRDILKNKIKEMEDVVICRY